MIFNFLFSFFVFILGLIIGSFLNCLVYRLGVKKSFLKERSFCPQCQHSLAWLDLIPLFSFILLKGKCRYCHKKISWQYPLVELSTGVVFLLVYIFQFNSSDQFTIFQFLNLFYYWLISSFLIVVFLYDLKHYLVLDEVIYPAIIIAGIYDLQFITQTGVFLPFLLSALGAAFFFFLLVFISKGRWMGGGDIKIAFLMGLILGWPNTLVALALAFYLGAFVGVGLILKGKKKMKSALPFAPFLITGTFLALFWGSGLIDWYKIIFLLK